MWRPATQADDDTIVAQFMALNAEDPGEEPARPEQMRRTLEVLRREPIRGRAVVADIGGQQVGYALLISAWSNEYDGEVCVIDELYLAPSHRSQGLGTSLFQAVVDDRALWPARPAVLELGVTPDNARARALYERLGFRARNVTLRRRLGRPLLPSQPLSARPGIDLDNNASVRDATDEN